MPQKHILPALTGVLAVALIAVAGYAFTSITSLNTDVASAKAQLAAAKSDTGERFRDVNADVLSIQTDVDDLQSTASENEKKAHLAQDSRTDVEKAIRKTSLIDLQKSSQVSDWKVHCVEATANTLDCMGVGFLDGEEFKQSYKATVDQNGSFIWKATYGE
jgi:hypothetical protein